MVCPNEEGIQVNSYIQQIHIFIENNMHLVSMEGAIQSPKSCIRKLHPIGRGHCVCIVNGVNVRSKGFKLDSQSAFVSTSRCRSGPSTVRLIVRAAASSAPWASKPRARCVYATSCLMHELLPIVPPLNWPSSCSCPRPYSRH